MILALLLATPLAAPIDPCKLLDPKAIEAVQGAAPTGAKPTERTDGPFAIRECFFSLADAVRSVSFEITTAQPSTLHERWEQLRGDEPRGKDDDEEEGRRPPRKVAGVGKAALWVGDARVGALYVLAKGAILRISVGGGGDVPSKIKACSALAKNALHHLSAARR
jgi:hypothetical protein